MKKILLICCLIFSFCGCMNNEIKGEEKNPDSSFYNLNSDSNNLNDLENALNDYTNAINWYKKAANHGSSRAQFNLGRIYDRRYGTHSGVVPNDELAKKYYLDAIYNTSEESKGRGWAVYNLWIVLQDENKIEEAKPILEFSVKNKVNLTEAPYLLAKVFYKDSEESLYYYRISAENGDERAQYELANMFASGKYIEKDLKEAGFWYRKAADQNHFGAQQEIGKCYEELYIKTLDNRYLELCLKYYYKIINGEYGDMSFCKNLELILPDCEQSKCNPPITIHSINKGDFMERCIDIGGH
jgi:TPR repeat protein